MKLREITRKIETMIPLAWAEEWDNPGLLAGDPEWEIGKIAVSLDATPRSVRIACEKSADLLVTHHPAFIHPVSSLSPETAAGAAAFEAIKRKVALYGIHTNWDVSPEGVNRILALKAGLLDPLPLIGGKGVPGDLERSAISPAPSPCPGWQSSCVQFGVYHGFTCSGTPTRVFKNSPFAEGRAARR